MGFTVNTTTIEDFSGPFSFTIYEPNLSIKDIHFPIFILLGDIHAEQEIKGSGCTDICKNDKWSIYNKEFFKLIGTQSNVNHPIEWYSETYVDNDDKLLLLKSQESPKTDFCDVSVMNWLNINNVHCFLNESKEIDTEQKLCADYNIKYYFTDVRHNLQGGEFIVSHFFYWYFETWPKTLNPSKTIFENWLQIFTAKFFLKNDKIEIIKREITLTFNFLNFIIANYNNPDLDKSFLEYIQLTDDFKTKKIFKLDESFINIFGLFFKSNYQNEIFLKDLQNVLFRPINVNLDSLPDYKLTQQSTIVYKNFIQSFFTLFSDFFTIYKIFKKRNNEQNPVCVIINYGEYHIENFRIFLSSLNYLGAPVYKLSGQAIKKNKRCLFLKFNYNLTKSLHKYFPNQMNINTQINFTDKFIRSSSAEGVFEIEFSKTQNVVTLDLVKANVTSMNCLEYLKWIIFEVDNQYINAIIKLKMKLLTDKAKKIIEANITTLNDLGFYVSDVSPLTFTSFYEDRFSGKKYFLGEQLSYIFNKINKTDFFWSIDVKNGHGFLENYFWTLTKRCPLPMCLENLFYSNINIGTWCKNVENVSEILKNIITGNLFFTFKAETLYVLDELFFDEQNLKLIIDNQFLKILVPPSLEYLNKIEDLFAIKQRWYKINLIQFEAGIWFEIDKTISIQKRSWSENNCLMLKKIIKSFEDIFTKGLILPKGDQIICAGQEMFEGENIIWKEKFLERVSIKEELLFSDVERILIKEKEGLKVYNYFATKSCYERENKFTNYLSTLCGLLRMNINTNLIIKQKIQNVDTFTIIEPTNYLLDIISSQNNNTFEIFLICLFNYELKNNCKNYNLFQNVDKINIANVRKDFQRNCFSVAKQIELKYFNLIKYFDVKRFKMDTLFRIHRIRLETNLTNNILDQCKAIFKAQFKKEYYDQNLKFYILMIDDKVLAFLNIVDGNKVVNFCSNPIYRGYNFGKMLLKIVVNIFKKITLESLYKLNEVLDENSEKRFLMYSKLGCKLIDLRKENNLSYFVFECLANNLEKDQSEFNMNIFNANN